MSKEDRASRLARRSPLAPFKANVEVHDLLRLFIAGGGFEI